MKKISLITVNYNTEKPLNQLLVNLGRQTMSATEFEVIIVNNNANGHQLELAAQHSCQFEVKIINNSRNLGFGVANNRGAQQAVGEYLLIINPDVILQQTDYLEKLYSYSQHNRHYGIISTRIVEATGYTTGPFYSYAYAQVFAQLPGAIASVIGALMLINKQLFLQLGGFDPDYFLYEEDIDLCLRVRQAGYAIACYSELSVVHSGGASETTTAKYEYMLKKKRGVYLFCLKHYSPQVFTQILKRDLSQALYKKIKLWLEIRIFQLKHKHNRYQEWCAVYAAAKQTLQTPEWLFNSYRES